jgi:basic amino acid/polyamine antiporter, APA family
LTTIENRDTIRHQREQEQLYVHNDWQPKLGDKIVRGPRVKIHPLRRVLGIPGLFSTAYGDLGSSIYYALGLVALMAMGAAPVALGIAGIFFVFTALTYAEGTAMFPEAGGSASFARHGLSDLMGFISGWSLMFGYIVTISISAYTIPSYLGYFWEPLKMSPMIHTAAAMGIVALLMIINVIGVRESSQLNFGLAMLDITTQLLIIIAAVVLLFNPVMFWHRITGYWPSTPNLIFGVAIAAIAFTGVETISQMSEEARRPQEKAPKAYAWVTIVVLAVYVGISVAAFSALTPPELGSTWVTDPVAGIAQGISKAVLPYELARGFSDPTHQAIAVFLLQGLRDVLPILVALLAATILFIATNAGLLGISRLAFSLGRFQLIPAELGRVHSRFKTPFIAILVFGLISVILQIPGFFGPDVFTNLGGLYAFGSMLSFALAHLSILALRIKRPEQPRPFKLRLNVKIGNRELPLTAILGLLGTGIIWVVVVIMQPYSRWVGFGWLLIGLGIFFLFRRLKRVSPE